MLLHESNVFPLLDVPVGNVSMNLLTKTEHSTDCPFRGDASHWTITAGDQVAENAAWGYETPLDTASCQEST